MADIIEALEKTRPDYEKERRWHKLLLDAYSGGGGFQGAIQQPTSSYWGPAAEIYSNAFYGESRTVKDIGQYYIKAGSSYLDRLPREDQGKYDARGDMSYFPNHIQGITDLKLSFLHSKPMQIEGRPEQLIEWRSDVNGKGQRYDEAKSSIERKAAILGWLPVLFDMPAAPVSSDGSPARLTKAQAGELGIRPRMIQLLPSNLVDFQLGGDGEFLWCKIRTDYADRPSPFDGHSCVSRYTIWYADHFQVFEVIDLNGKKNILSQSESAHDFGMVPLAIQRYQPCPDDPVRGTPMHGQESLANRSLYSRVSEYDEHIQKQQAAIFVYATNNPEQAGELVVGPENALTIPLEAGQQHYYLAPPSSVSEVYRTRTGELVTEIYRMAGVEFLLNSQVPLSGVSRRYQFMQLNTDIAGFAQETARFEASADRIVGRMLGIDDAELRNIKYIPPTNFDVEDLAEQIKNSSDMLQLGLGPTADRTVRMRVVEHALPNLPDEVKAQIQDELEQDANNQANDAMLSQEIAGLPVDAEANA